MDMASSKPVAMVIGASRGIGRQVAIDLSKEYIGKYIPPRTGPQPSTANTTASRVPPGTVVVAAKTTSDASQCHPFPPDPNSPQSTINTVAREITAAGGEALAIRVDVRDADDVARLVRRTVDRYGRIDVVVYNSGAIWWAGVAQTPVKRFRLMQQVNPEGLYATVQAVLPHLYRNGEGGGAGRIVVVSPPIYSRFVRGKTAYAMGKFGMSVLTLGQWLGGVGAWWGGEMLLTRECIGLAVDFEREGRTGLAITSLWPAAVCCRGCSRMRDAGNADVTIICQAIDSAATQKVADDGSQGRGRGEYRKATIFSDAILAILRAPSRDINGKTLLDEDFLREHEGIQDFSKYDLVPGSTPRRIMPIRMPDLTVPEQDDEGVRVESSAQRVNKL
jgi:NAD(P)-dependent dehydrogenase (short-subunit alcohol dehydrogenase family)